MQNIANVLNIGKFGFRICFVFRASDLEFSDKPKRKRPKTN
jgi:hypothetical protein